MGNLHKAGASSASFLEKSSEEQPAAAAASDVLRDLDRPVVEEEALNGMYERKTQMPMVYLNLHKAGASSASFLEKASGEQPAAAASEALSGLDRPVVEEEALN